MTTGADDVVGVGGDLEPDTLIGAYARGIFPWPADDLPLLWFCPVRRGILELDRLHVSRSLARARRRLPFHCTIDRAFSRVIRACAAAPRPDQEGTWITPEMVRAYERLHALGHAHSVEAWQGERLIGGTYGVDAGGAFSAESMFHHESYASQLALLHLLEHLAARGLEWIDIQMVTPHMERLGAREVSRGRFLALLREARARGLRLFD